MSAVPSRMVIDIPAGEQARLRKQLRGARWGGWLVLHILLLLAQPRSPTEIADWLLCSRWTVYAAAHAWPSGRRPWDPLSGSGSMPLAREACRGRGVSRWPGGGACWRCCRKHLLSMAGVARAGVVRRWPKHSGSGTAGRCRRKPCGAGGTLWTGAGSEPSWRPKTMIPNGFRNWPPFACAGKRCRLDKSSCLPMSSTLLSCPSLASSGCKKARRSK